MKLYIFLIAFILPNGSLVSGASIVQACPTMEQVIEYVRLQSRETNAVLWTANCAEMDFLPMFQEETT